MALVETLTSLYQEYAGFDYQTALHAAKGDEVSIEQDTHEIDMIVASLASTEQLEKEMKCRILRSMECN